MNADPSMSRNLRARNLRTVGALAALFLLPLVLSFWMYYGGGWQPLGHTNYGELLQPVRPLPLDRWPEGKVLTEKWSLVYIVAGNCDSRCRDALIVMRQTRLSLNQDMQRVNRVLIAGHGCCDETFLQREHAGLLVLDADSQGASEALRVFPAGKRADSIFLVDPLGNLVMRYDDRTDPKGLLQDLKKLLKLSHIG
jgi:hypothetical protein